MCVCMCVCVCVCVCVCMHLCVYMCAYMYLYHKNKIDTSNCKFKVEISFINHLNH